MVNKIFTFLSKDIGSLHEAAYLLAGFAFLSQILAIVRDRFLANAFGASHTLDIYYASFRIPDLIFVSVASLVSVSVIIPFLNEKILEGKDSVKKFVNSLFSFFVMLMFIVSFVTFFLIPFLIPVIFPGITDSSSQNEIIVLTRILLLSPIFLGISNFFGAIAQTYKKFVSYALSPVLYNLGIIVGIVFFYPFFGLNGLIYGVILGAILHCFIQLPAIIKCGVIPRPTFAFDFSSIKSAVSISVPRTLTLALSHVVMLVLVAIASLMKEGSISVFNFSFNLQSVPLSIIGVSYSLAAFPTLSAFFSKGEKDNFFDHLIIGTRHIIFWSAPIIVLFIILRAQIVRTILGSGEFNWSDTRLVAASLAIFAISALSQSLILLFVRAYYASGRTKFPFVVNVISSMVAVVLVIGFSFIFKNVPVFRYFIESLLRVEDIAGTEVLMLPLGFSLAMIINGIILWLNLGVLSSQKRKIWRSFFQSLGASVIMGFASYVGLNVFVKVFDVNTLFGIFMQGFCAGIFGIIIGSVTLWILGNEEIRDIWKMLHHKIWKTVPVVPETTNLQ